MSSSKFMFEIDFLAVGNGEKSGDAIAVRYGFPNDLKVIIIDGGNKDSGRRLVEHVRKYYERDNVDFVVNTHPDGDHASGLSVVLEELKVGELWMHRPWAHSKEIKGMFRDGRMTDNSLSERLKDGLKAAYRLEVLAKQKNIAVKEPFEGATVGAFTVLSPSEKWYLELIPQFDNSPEAAKSMAKSLLAEEVRYVQEDWDKETLSDPGEYATSASNLSSVVLFGRLDGQGILLTGDAGIETLTQAISCADKRSWDLSQARFMQVPHHGSRHNVSPELLDNLLGPKVAKSAQLSKTVYVSASQRSTTHPRKAVTNAYQRRRAKVVVTKGSDKRYSHNAPKREGWVRTEPLKFFSRVEE